MLLVKSHIKECYVLLKMVKNAMTLTQFHNKECYNLLSIVKSNTLLAKILFIIVIIQGIGFAMSDSWKAQGDRYAKQTSNWSTMTKLLGKIFFYYGRGMQDKYIQLNRNVLDYIGKEYTMKLRTVGGLALSLSSNLQGDICCCCYSQDTDKVLDCFLHNITIMKMPTVACCRFAY